MSKAYPHFKPSYSHNELVAHFLLTPAELQLVLALRGDANRCGAALLPKVLPYLGHVPEGFGQIPQEVRAFIAGQLGLLWDQSDGYPWHSSTRDHHLAQVRHAAARWKHEPRLGAEEREPRGVLLLHHEVSEAGRQEAAVVPLRHRAGAKGHRGRAIQQ